MGTIYDIKDVVHNKDEKNYVRKITKFFINMIKSKVHFCLNKSCICLTWLVNETIWDFWKFMFYLENWVCNAKNIVQGLMIKDWLMCNVRSCFNKYHICDSRVHFLTSSYQSSHTLRFFFQFFKVVSCWPPFEEGFSIKWSHVLKTYLNSFKLIF